MWVGAVRGWRLQAYGLAASRCTGWVARPASCAMPPAFAMAAKGALADLAPQPVPLSVPPALPPYAATPVQPRPFTSVN